MPRLPLQAITSTVTESSCLSSPALARSLARSRHSFLAVMTAVEPGWAVVKFVGFPRQLQRPLPYLPGGIGELGRTGPVYLLSLPASHSSQDSTWKPLALLHTSTKTGIWGLSQSLSAPFEAGAALGTSSISCPQRTCFSGLITPHPSSQNKQPRCCSFCSLRPPRRA